MGAKVLFAVCLTVVFTGCTKAKSIIAGTSNHKVTFTVKVISHDGPRPLKIECAKFEEFAAYMRDQSAAMMSGKKPTVEKPKLIEFKTPGQPESNLTATLELPSDKMTCAIDGKFMNVKMGEQSSEVFVPKGEASIAVEYNMYTKKLIKADATGSTIELAKI